MHSSIRRASALGSISSRSGIVSSLILAMSLTSSIAFAANSDLTDLSLEDLMNTQVTSVSKKAQSKTDAAASITVISNEDLRRGGFLSVPEALRMVPGLQVAQIDANRWAISARGFNQEFANKLLVLVDGRSVYTPLFGGVYWDVQDYPIEDIERIEVIRGPGGTLWGTNAVNGVINVITKDSANTQGALLSGEAGSQQNGAMGRYGASLGEDTTFRVYAKGDKINDYDVDGYHDAKDRWSQVRGGFRADSKPTEQDEIMVSGDYYNVSEDRGVFTGTSFVRRTYSTQGGNVLANWKHKISDSQGLQLKAFYDQTVRDGANRETRQTGDVEFQHDFSLNEGGTIEPQITWGLNYRFSHNDIDNQPTLSLIPSHEDYHLGNGFVQGQVDLFDDQIALIAGIKLYGDNWTGFEYQPSGRILWRVAEGHTVWAAVSRAVRTPTQLDRDLFAILPSGVPIPPTITLQGSNDTRSEEVVAYEGGYRFFLLDWVTAEASAFYNVYDNVSSLSTTANPTVFTFTNLGEVKTAGTEIEVSVLPVDWWRTTLGYSYLHVDANTPPSPLGGTSVKDSSPKHQVVLRSFFDLPYDFEFDASLYWIDGLDITQLRIPPPNQNIDSYFRLDLRIGYKPADWIELALVGQNLTSNRHAEFNDVQSNLASEVPRSGYGKVTLRF